MTFKVGDTVMHNGERGVVTDRYAIDDSWVLWVDMRLGYIDWPEEQCQPCLSDEAQQRDRAAAHSEGRET